MKTNKLVVLIVLCALLLSVSIAQAADKTFTVTYHENNCLATVPTDDTEYEAGDEVTVVFEPVTYKDGLIFFGWGFEANGTADFGYSYYNFNMPEKDVDLYAICISPSYSAPAPGPRPGPHPGPRPPRPIPLGPGPVIPVNP